MAESPFDRRIQFETKADKRRFLPTNYMKTKNMMWDRRSLNDKSLLFFNNRVLRHSHRSSYSHVLLDPWSVYC